MQNNDSLLLKGNPTKGLISAIIALYFGFAGVAFFGAAAPVFKVAMELTPFEVGILVAIPSLAGGILRIPFGAWADSNGGRKPILILLILTLVGLFIFAIMTIFFFNFGVVSKKFFPILLLCGLLVGCGVGVFTAGIAYVSYWFNERKQGMALGLYSGIGGLSSGVVTIFIPFGLLFFGVIGVYVSWFMIVLIGTVAFYLLSSNAYYFQFAASGMSHKESKDEALRNGCDEFPNGKMIATLKQAAKNRRTWALTIVYFSTFGGSLALTSWLPSFWTMNYAMQLTTAGILTGLSSMFSPFMRIFGGFFADRFGGEKVSMVALVICLTGSIILSLSSSPIISALGIFMMVGGIGVSNASIFKLVPIYIHGAVGGASGIIGGIGAMGGFAIPPILGATVSIMGQNGYNKGFFIYSILFLICIFVVGVLYVTKNSVKRI